MTERDTWTRREGKRPVRLNGRNTSTTDPRSWSSYAEVTASDVGDGLGIMLGAGLGCFDLDHCFDGRRLAPWAADFLAAVADPIWVERSMSGEGLHIFVAMDEAPGTKRDGVETYSRQRFIAVTGDRFNF